MCCYLQENLHTFFKFFYRSNPAEVKNIICGEISKQDKRESTARRTNHENDFCNYYYYYYYYLFVTQKIMLYQREPESYWMKNE